MEGDLSPLGLDCRLYCNSYLAIIFFSSAFPAAGLISPARRLLEDAS